MPISKEQLQSVMVGNQESRVEALRQIFDYPLKQRDPEGSQFWFLRPGADEAEAEETCPIAVGFYSELNHLNKDEIRQFLTAEEQQKEIYGHYTRRIIPNQPVMYLLLPEDEGLGRVAMVLPTEGKLRQRQIRTFAWTDEDLRARLNRLKQESLARTNRMKYAALSIIPLVEWAFYDPIATAKELAQELAKVSQRIERAIPDRTEELNSYLQGLLKSFQRELLPTLKLKSDNEKDYSFADIYAQTIAYGLFTARVFGYTIDERKRKDEHDPGRKETDFNRENAWEFLPETNPFLRRLFRDVSQQPIEELGDDLADAITEVFSILRAAKMDAILEDFRAKMNREDIVIRFYEDFLTAYKPKMRERRGVYYTPEPVVSYMVRSVDILLKEKFNKPLGLADPEVMILDPACGTGTFLLWVFQLIYKRFTGQEKDENLEMLPVYEALKQKFGDMHWSEYVKDYLLPRVFGFELLMAPYAIAHLKLSLYLEETGYKFGNNIRLGVYLTNSLDNAYKKSETLFEEFIAEEADQATEIKRNKEIVVIIGNPPYEGESANKDLVWINSLVRGLDSESGKKTANYFAVDGVSLTDLGERNTKWLNNDYVKFIRFSQWRIDKTGSGILSLITDRSYLGGPTFRGMRQCLINSFDYLNILDLHGNIRGKRKSMLSEIINDDNVFKISQGVVINTFVKSKDSNFEKGVFYHSDLWGKWEEFENSSSGKLLNNCKSAWLLSNCVNLSQKAPTKQPISPDYLFEIRTHNPEKVKNDENISTIDENIEIEYSKGWKITDIFSIQSMGVTGGRDKSDLSPHFSRQVMWEVLSDFVALSIENARDKYKLGQDARDWKIELAQSDIMNSGPEEDKILPILYRPFDTRFTYYTGKSRGFHCMPRHEVMRNLISGENLALCFIRTSREGIDSNYFVSNKITDKTILSSSDNANIAPLYIRPDEHSPNELQESLRHNISKGVLDEIKKKLNYVPIPEAIFYYIYAVLYSPAYRDRYSEFLNVDFSRIPFASNDALFRQLAIYGEELVAFHLMRSPKLDNLITQLEDQSGNWIVDAGHPKYADGKVIINKKGDGFTGVPEEVWNFYVGGYQVCHKWLKDRKGRTLSDEDVLHYQKIVVALQETIGLMQQIDEAIPSWPIT